MSADRDEIAAFPSSQTKNGLACFAVDDDALESGARQHRARAPARGSMLTQWNAQ
jgi:hypothetical protein